MAINELKPVETIRVLKNGAHYDTETKRIVKGPDKPPITAENAREYQLRAIAKKREAVLRAANREVAPELIAEFGEYAWAAEGAVNMQRLASSPEAGKAAVMAFEALQRAAGVGEGKQADDTGGQSQAAVTLSLSADAVRMLASLVAGDNSNYRNQSPPAVVDADAVTVQQGDGGE